ncbi:ANKRD52 [Symbiodinium sp. CCMP2592]|nr:ANKRD52 [Symbiodinium sp. CCMP2592]
MAAMAYSFSSIMSDGTLDTSRVENSLLDRIDELETYNKQMNRLGEVRLLQLRHAKDQLLQKRRRADSDEVSVVDFSCRTPSASSTAPAPAQVCSPSKASERSGESLDTMTTATILAKNRELQRVSSALAAKAQEAEIYKQELAMTRQEKRHSAPPKLRKETAHGKTPSPLTRDPVLAQPYTKREEESGATLRGAAQVLAHGADETLRTHLVDAQFRGSSAASSPLKRLTEEAAVAREEASRSCKDELLSWASHLEARAEEFFSTELRTAAALTKEEARASHEALRQSLALELKEEMVAASDAIQERAQLRVFAARKECRSELRMLRQEQEAAMHVMADQQNAEMALQMRVQSTEQAMEQAAQQEHAQLQQKKEVGEQQLATARAKLDEERHQLQRMREVSETQLAKTTSQLEDAASQLSRLEAAQQRTREEMAAHHSAAAASWNRSLASAQAARAQAESVLKAASKTWESSRSEVSHLQPPSLGPAASRPQIDIDLLELDDIDEEVDKFLNYRPADVKSFAQEELPGASVQLLSTTTSFESEAGATDSGGSSSMPLVYAAALEGIETHGWSAVYPLDDPPAWTILHWAAMEGRLEICRRLLAAGANPFCEDERGWTPLDCADEAGEVEVSNLLVAHAPDADLGQGGAMHPVLAAAVTAVENYGWQAVHEGRREWTALHWAASEGNKALCARLLLHDADPSQVDQAGRSALDYARNAGHRSTFEMLWQSQQRRIRRSAPATSASPQQEFKPAPAAYPQSLRLPPATSEGTGQT